MHAPSEHQLLALTLNRVKGLENENFTANAITYIHEKLDRMSDPNALVIIYPVSESSVQEYAHTFNCHSFYAKLEYRWEYLEEWASGSGSNMMVATSALGTGVDVLNIALTFHVDAMLNPFEFVQQSGRSARGRNDRGTSYCVLPQGRHQQFSALVS